MYLRMSSVMLLASVLCLLTACNKSNLVNAPAPTQSISFLNKGAVVPHPVSTLVTVGQDSIKLFSAQNGDTIESWSSILSPEDFSHLISILNENSLMGTHDPVLPQGVTGCFGHQGMTIVMIKDSIMDTLNISGLLWCTQCRVYWPSGLESLIEFEDSLINKYKP